MKRRFGFTALLVTLLLLIASPAFATHAGAEGEIHYIQTYPQYGGGIRETATTGPVYSECSTTQCTVTMPLPSREYVRFLRWCGSDRVTVRVPVGDSWNWVDCSGEGTLSMRVYGEIIHTTSLPAPETHDAPVDVTIIVVGKS